MSPEIREYLAIRVVQLCLDGELDFGEGVKLTREELGAEAPSFVAALGVFDRVFCVEGTRRLRQGHPETHAFEDREGQGECFWCGHQRFDHVRTAHARNS